MSVFILICEKQPHLVRVLLAMNGARHASDIVIVGPVALDRHEPHHQLLLHLFHLLFLSFFGLHLVHKFGPSFL